MRAVASAPQPAGRVALFGWPVDLALLGVGGAIAFAALAGLWTASGRGGASPRLALAAFLVVVGPHYGATYVRAYASLAMVRRHAAVTIVAPLVLLALAAASLRSPTGVAPWFVITYVAWSGYHYAAQSIGVAMIYPLRQGLPLDAVEKRLIGLPLLASWALSLAGFFQVAAAPRNLAFDFARAGFPSLRLPPEALLGCALLLAASLSGPAWVALARARRGTPLPSLSLAVVAAQVVWFSWGLFDPLFAALAVPVLHAAQYLALTTWHHARAGGPGAARLPRYAAALGLIALGLHRAAILVERTGVDPIVCAATVAAFVNLHHFLLDGRIWRLREPSLRAAMAA